MNARFRAAGAAAGFLIVLSFGGLEAFGQTATRPPASAQPSYRYGSPAQPPAWPSNGLRRVAYQEPAPPTPAPTLPDAAPAPPVAPGGGGGFQGSEPLRSNTDLSLPASEREGLGGEPTEATAASEAAKEGEGEGEGEKAPEKDPTKLLMNALGLEESPVKIYGWIQNSFTGNANGTPKNRLNFGVNPNFLANSWMGNQYYLILENPLEQGDKVNFGFRVDNLFGNDWQFNHAYGLLNTVAKPNHFNGYDPAQIYGEVHLPPVLSKGGTDIKGGRFYTILGYEVVPATGRPLLSVPYMFNYGQPFTHFGALATTHVTDRVNWYNGAVNGWDRWINENYKWNYLGGVNWTSKSGKANLAVSYIFGPNQFPNFLPANTVIVPTGTTPPPYLAGRRNPGYGSNWRTTFTTVLSYKWTDTFVQVLETDQSIEKNIPNLGVGGTPNDATWYSFGNWFLWQFYKKDDRDVMTAVWRSEVFRDNNGARTGFADNFYEMTLGLIWKPKPYLWVRPEARYDWAQFTRPYNDGTRNSQLTLG
ncbi:MAG: outer membrane beta-barrel protein, partial [Isosphaeraceae bacterium]